MSKIKCQWTTGKQHKLRVISNQELKLTSDQMADWAQRALEAASNLYGIGVRRQFYQILECMFANLLSLSNIEWLHLLFKVSALSPVMSGPAVWVTSQTKPLTLTSICLTITSTSTVSNGKKNIYYYYCPNEMDFRKVSGNKDTKNSGRRRKSALTKFFAKEANQPTDWVPVVNSVQYYTRGKSNSWTILDISEWSNW